MTSAKVIIREQDRSAIVPAFDGIYAGVVVVSEKGPVGTPRLITSINQLIDVYGTPNPRLGVSMYSAMNYLSQGNKLWVVRAAHDDSKSAAVLVRSKILPPPQGRTDSLSSEHLIVNPIKSGLTAEELESYSFPVYRTNKLYEALVAGIFEESIDSDEVRVEDYSELAVGDAVSFTTTSLSALNSPNDDVGETEPTYQVIDLVTRTLAYDNAIVESPVSVQKGQQVRKKLVSGDVVDYQGNPTVVRTASNTTNILISNADFLAPGDTLVIGSNEVTFNEKVHYTEEGHFVKVDAPVIVTPEKIIYKVVQSELEERDAFLVVAANAGRWGNHLSIAITPSRDYDNAFNIIVYYKGVQVESWEVTRDAQLDGFGRQMHLEQRINGKSAYIKIVNNEANFDGEVYHKPLFTDYSLWRQDADDIFVDAGIELQENLLKGHKEVKLSGLSNLSLGSRIKFVIGDNYKLSKEYKVQSLDSAENSVTLDRPIEEDQISSQWVDGTGTSITTKVYWFDATNNDLEAGIVDGIQFYPVSRIDRVFYNYPLNARFTISGSEGTLLSAGANMTTGGSLGSTASVGDLIRAVKKLGNKESTPITLLMDGGFAIPAFAQAIDEVAEAHGLTHGYLSVSQDAEEAADYLSAIVGYKNSCNLNTHRCSMFTGWIKIYDEYNQLEVWVSPEGFAASSQSFTTRNYNMWYPAAGWTRGMVRGLDVKVKFSEGDRDFLVDNRLNPIRQRDGSGLAIWGNETLLTRPSPMQLRSVSMLLIVIKHGLESMLEYKTFDLNNERTWNIVEGTLDGFMRDEIQSKGGVYNYEVAVQDAITSTDLDNRRMPVFLGIQPTMDIKTIPVTLAIFNSSVDIDVAL